MATTDIQAKTFLTALIFSDTAKQIELVKERDEQIRALALRDAENALNDLASRANAHASKLRK